MPHRRFPIHPFWLLSAAAIFFLALIVGLLSPRADGPINAFAVVSVGTTLLIGMALFGSAARHGKRNAKMSVRNETDNSTTKNDSQHSWIQRTLAPLLVPALFYIGLLHFVRIPRLEKENASLKVRIKTLQKQLDGVPVPR